MQAVRRALLEKGTILIFFALFEIPSESVVRSRNSAPFARKAQYKQDVYSGDRVNAEEPGNHRAGRLILPSLLPKRLKKLAQGY